MPAAGFSLEEESTPLAHVISVSGELDVATAPSLRTAIARARRNGCERLVVDLCGASLVDTVGMSVLLGAWRRTREGGRMALVCVPGPVLQAFKIAGLEGTVPLFVSRDAALDQYAREDAPPVTV